MEDASALPTPAGCSALSTPFQSDFTAHEEGFETRLRVVR